MAPENMAPQNTALNSMAPDTMAQDLAGNWWALVLRGIAGVLFGAIALLSPPSAVAALVLLFGAYAFVDGIFNLISAVRVRREGKKIGALVFEGIISLLTGLVTMFWPGITALVLVMVVAAWSLITGAAEIVAAIRLRKQIKHEWLLALSGVLSILFGVLLFLLPAVGAVVLAMWIGAYTLVFGALLIGLGLRVRSWARSHQQEIPGTAVPRPA
jgi:uncharacterized membrane protein HdeD (DUF308 family)